MIFGIDTSRYQYDAELKKNFDWKKAKSEGVRFAGIRATVGDYYTDPTLDRSIKGAQDNEIVPVPYCVPAINDGALPRRSISPSDTIDRFLNAINKYDIDEDAHVLDLEIVRSSNYLTGRYYKAVAKEFLKHASTFIWYSNQNIAETVMAPDAAFWNKYHFWVASYTKAQVPAMPKWASNWSCWQYSSTGDGLGYGAASRYIDLNRMKPELFTAITTHKSPEPIVNLEMPEKLVELSINGVLYTGEMVR